jgi:hypothetical protein
MESDHSHTSTGPEDGLQALLARLEHQSLQPDFLTQRRLALELALQPYLDPRINPPLTPLPEEGDLAKWYLYADYFPTDGHFSLIEQVRDLITEHVSEEERVWLDPIRHSYMDLLQVIARIPDNQSPLLRLQSLGNQQVFEVPFSATSIPIQTGHIFLTRIIRGGPELRLPGFPLIMSSTIGKAVTACTESLRRELEIETGNFGLSEWPEFAKSYGYLMMWSLAKVRRGIWAEADSHIPYLNPKGEPFLYAIALYEHHDFHLLKEGLDGLKDFTPVAVSAAQPSTSIPTQDSPLRIWVQRQENTDSMALTVSRLTLTPTQLSVETDSPVRLDAIKHQVAALFGFSLHFQGETTTPPQHTMPEVDILSDTYTPSPTIVPQEEEQQILSSFLESVYLEWAERPSAVLHGQTPRHVCAKSQDNIQVAELIDCMEHHDLAYRRTGKVGYDYNILRGHVGL